MIRIAFIICIQGEMEYITVCEGYLNLILFNVNKANVNNGIKYSLMKINSLM